jgi:hypothetical protein
MFPSGGRPRVNLNQKAIDVSSDAVQTFSHISLRSKSILWPASLLPPRIMASRVSSADRDAWWTSIKLVLDVLFTFPSEALHTDVLYSVTPAAYSDTYTAAFKWAHTGGFGVPGPLPYMDGNHELYMLLDHLLGESCQILYPQLTSLAGKELLQAYNQLYKNFARRAATAARLLSYLDRRLWKTQATTGKDWLHCPDPVPVLQQASDRDDWIKRFTNERRAALQTIWEMPEGSQMEGEEWTQAVQRAEASWNPKELACVHVRALVLRRWRINVLEPLLAGPFSSEQLLVLSSEDGTDVANVDLLLQSMKDVGLKENDENRKRFREIYDRVSPASALA